MSEGCGRFVVGLLRPDDPWTLTRAPPAKLFPPPLRFCLLGTTQRAEEACLARVVWSEANRPSCAIGPNLASLRFCFAAGDPLLFVVSILPYGSLIIIR